MAKERALDIFDLLSKVDRKDYDLWNKLTDEQKKEFSPLVVMRWMAGCEDPYQLIVLNEIVNTTVFSIGAKPERKDLMLTLLTVSSNGRSKRYKWKPYKVSGSKKQSMSVELIAKHYRMSFADATEALKLFTPDEVIEVALAQGWQKEEVAELKKELK